MEPICYLLFVSQSLSSAKEEAQRALEENAILCSAAGHSITGSLIYRRGYLMHYLEGNEQDVLDLYRQLRTLNRHCNVRVLGQGALHKRLYSSWSIHWVTNDDSGPSSESLIDLFETVLSAKSICQNELEAILRRFGKNATKMLLNPPSTNSEARL